MSCKVNLCLRYFSPAPFGLVKCHFVAFEELEIVVYVPLACFTGFSIK